MNPDEMVTEMMQTIADRGWPLQRFIEIRRDDPNAIVPAAVTTEILLYLEQRIRELTLDQPPEKIGEGG